MSGWFAGPKAENSEPFVATIERILNDYYYWRRNYFPEDGIVVDAAVRRENEPFEEKFQDKLLELLGLLKADYPFYSPRYAAHMVSESSLPSVAGYFAGMLYNPNNVTSEAAPVTVRLEIEVAQMISKMLGYDDHSWAHLTGGGTVANIEALWIARSVKYLPFITRDLARQSGISCELTDLSPVELLGLAPHKSLTSFRDCFERARASSSDQKQALSNLIGQYRISEFNVASQGWQGCLRAIDSQPVILAPETAHYCIPKAADILGMGRDSVIRIPVDSDFRMRIDELEAALENVRKQGKHTIAVIAVVGTTEEGAIDPVHKIAALRKKRQAEGKGSFWLHADAAYGGYLRTVTVPSRLGLGDAQTRVSVAGKQFMLPLELPIGTSCDALEALGECDSIVVDPHKLGYAPYPAGAVCFKSNLVKPVVRQEAPYIEEAPQSVEKEAVSDAIGVYILEGSKPGASAASLWLSHSLIPLDRDGHGKLMQQNIRNACELHALLERWPELAGPSNVQCIGICPPGSNIVCFLFLPLVGDRTLKQINHLNRSIYSRFSSASEQKPHIYNQRFFISRTELTSKTYGEQGITPFLNKMGVSYQEFEREGVFVLRSVLMNPWLELAKERGRFFLSELAKELYEQAAAIASQAPA